MDQPQLDHILVRKVRIDSSAETICRVIIGRDYIILESTTECDYRLRVAYDQNIK